jgi:hypothetical protein
MLLGVFHSFDPLHPLAHSFHHLNCDWRVCRPGDALPPAQFVVTDAIAQPGADLYYLTEATLAELDDLDPAEAASWLAGREVWSPSVRSAQNFRDRCGVGVRVVPPWIEAEPAVPTHLLFDPAHPYVGPLQDAFPRESFRPYGSLDDLAGAKAFLPVPGRADMRLAWAAARLVPVVVPAGADCEWAVAAPPADPAAWVRAVRGALRDRLQNAGKLKAVANRYRSMSDFRDRVRQALRMKPTRAEAMSMVPFQPARPRPPGRPRPSPVGPVVPPGEPADTIVLTGGLGDVLALESYMSDEQRGRLHTICYATNKRHLIRPLFDALPNYPSLRSHLTVWDDFSAFWCFLSKEECCRRLSPVPPELAAAEDWSILPKFAAIRAGRLSFNRSSVLVHPMADVSGLVLPDRYVAICPYSSDKRVRERDFDDADWAATLFWLVKKGLTGVVLTTGGGYVPDTPSLVNLSDRTTVPEAIEVLKRAVGYVGIDSSLSVLGAKLFDPPMLAVKSRNDHCYANKGVYYAPKQRFDFLGHSLTKLLKL